MVCCNPHCLRLRGTGPEGSEQVLKYRVLEVTVYEIHSGSTCRGLLGSIYRVVTWLAFSRAATRAARAWHLGRMWRGEGERKLDRGGEGGGLQGGRDDSRSRCTSAVFCSRKLLSNVVTVAPARSTTSWFCSTRPGLGFGV